MILDYKMCLLLLMVLTLAACTTTDEGHRPVINYADTYQAGETKK
ncbi:MAG: hypothetical protein K0Q78_974, partial [Cellvibrio sp.]|nr:hypothetical protein [Cellvibrio sp.]